MTGTEQNSGRQYDWGETDPSTAVVETIAEASGTDEIDISPLYDTIDPDALDAIFAGETTDDGTEVTFVHAGYHVVVASDGRVNVMETQSPS